MVWDFSDLNSNFYEFLKLQPFSGISYNKQKDRSRDDRHAAHSPSAREGLPGVIRGAAGWHPGGLRLGLTRDTRRNRRHPGKTHSALGYAAHSGLAGGIRDSPGVSLGTRGDSEGSRGSLLFSHSERWQVRVASGGSYLPGVLGDKCGVRKALGGWSESLPDRVSA